MGDERPDWVGEAACRGLADRVGGVRRDSIMFPGRGQSVEPGKAVCARCPVTGECLDYALDNQIPYGIWGGQTAIDRRKIQRTRRKAQP